MTPTLLHAEPALDADDFVTARPTGRHRAGSAAGTLTAVLVTATLGLLAVVLTAGAAAGAHSHSSDALRAPREVLAAATASTSTSATTSAPSAPTGDPSTTVTSPSANATVTVGSPVTLSAALSPDLVTALRASTGGQCYFEVGNDAGDTATGTLDLTAATCSASWTYSYAGSFSVVAHVNVPGSVTYSSAPVPITVSGSANPRCSGVAGAPTTCVYRWAEVYYDSTSTRHARVCSIDGGCQWQSAHLSWTQVPNADYWLNRGTPTLPDGNSAEAYVCFGSSPTQWSSYTSTHDFAALLGRADTNVAPIPSGTCTS